MSEKREILGQWWLPAQPNEKWIGTLTLEPAKSPRLKVFVPQGFFGFLQMKAPPVIHGHDEQGRPITLLFPGWPQTHGGMAMTHVAFTAGYAVLGIELAGPAEFSVNTLTFRTQHLYGWLGITGFLREPQNMLADHSITYQRPENQSFPINSDLTLEIRATHSFSHSPSEQVVSEDMSLSFVSSKGLGLKDCKNLMSAVRNLLHFATIKPVYLLSMVGEKKDHGQTIDGRFSPQDIEIWNSIIREPVESDPRWIFRFSDVRSRFSQFFSDWLTFSSKFHEALECYTTTVYHRPPSEVELLCLAQALEAYHGATSGRQPFAARVQTLTQQFMPHLKGLVSSAATFAQDVRDNRNYFTHHDRKIKSAGRVLSGAKLIRLNEKLRLLIQMCVLTEMGIPADRFAILRRQLATEIIDYI